MKKMFLIFLCLIVSVCSAQPSHYGPYDPGAIRSDGTNASDTVTFNSIKAKTSGGLTIKGSGGATAMTIGAGGGTAVSTADGLNVGDVLKTATGTAAAPAYSFSSDPDTGIYSPGADTLGFGVGSIQVATLSSSGLDIATPLSVANGGTGATTAAAGLAALGGASLNGSSTVEFAASRVTADNHVINTDGYVRATGAFVYSANIGSIASGAARYIDFSLGSSGGFTSEVLTNMQFSVSKQAGGVWYSTAAYNATTGLSGLTTLQTVDLDDSQLLTVTWSQPAVNTLRLTLTNTHTSTLYAVSVSVKVTSDRASFMTFKAKG